MGGLYLALGVAAALLERERSGRARVLDLSNQDAIFAVTDSAATLFAGIGARSPRVGNQHPFTAPYDAFAARDGWVVIATASNKLFRQLCAAIGRPGLGGRRALPQPPRPVPRTAARSTRSSRDWVGARSCDEVLAALGPRGARLPCARVAGPEELLGDPQLAARGMLERHPHPALGEIVLHGNPLRFDGAEPRERALAPALGADNAAIYGELGIGEAELARLAAEGVV